MSFDGRKDIQFIKSAWFICIESLKPASSPLPRGLMKEVQQTFTFD